MNKKTVYWAAPLFTQAERIWNRMCAEELSEYGYTVILPQDEAKQFGTEGSLDFKALAFDCRKKALAATFVVAILDGPDSDSGTTGEAFIKIENGGKVLGVRTDFRKAEDGNLNGMFQLLTRVMYYSSLSESVRELVANIHKELKTL